MKEDEGAETETLGTPREAAVAAVGKKSSSHRHHRRLSPSSHWVISSDHIGPRPRRLRLVGAPHIHKST